MSETFTNLFVSVALRHNTNSKTAVMIWLQMRVLLCLFIVLLSAVLTDSTETTSYGSNGSDWVTDIDHNIQYGLILPYAEEWNAFFSNSTTHELSPFQFWFKCIGNNVRGYLFIEKLGKVTHGKEAVMVDRAHLLKYFKILADGQPIKLFRVWHGGGDFFFDLPEGTPSNHKVDIQVVGFRHYTRFRVSNCVKKPAVSAETKYLMHIHLRDYSVKHEYQKSIIDGIAYHMAYHRCALNLDKYEVVIQEEHLQQYLANSRIAHAVKQGWIRFIIRNPVIPAPLMQVGSSSNCYYQAHTENMALLRHWQENVRMFFWDSDEFLATAPDVTPKELTSLVLSKPSVGFKRRMIFCDDCDSDKSEIMSMSLTKSRLVTNTIVLAHPKLNVDPNQVGCFIVHWSGCGFEAVNLPLDRVYITHFENLHQKRWSRNRRKKYNETLFVPSAIQKTCDPVNYDWSGPLPSFHTVGNV